MKRINKRTAEENPLMPNSSDRDWVEDFTHENGNYCNKCIECSLYFYGHKRRVICKKCDGTLPALKFKFDPNAQFTFDEWQEISKKKRPEDTKDNKAWAGAWLEGEMVGYAKCMVERVASLEEEVEMLNNINIMNIDNNAKLESNLSAMQELQKATEEVLKEFSPRWDRMSYPEISVHAESIREKYTSLRSEVNQ